MSALVEIVTRYLDGRASLTELSEATAAARREMEAHRADVSAMLAGLPDFTVARERDDWQSVQGRLNALLTEAESDFRDQSKLRKLTDEFPDLSDKLRYQAMLVREAAWSARGPSSHPGVNELLYLFEQVDEGDQQSESMLVLRLELELERIDSQAQRLGNLPEFAAEAMQELLGELQEWLHGVLEAEEHDWEELAHELEEWSLNYTSYDVDYLLKRYSHVPTPIPAVNFVLNCQRLSLEEFIPEEMVDFALDSALETLENGSQAFLDSASLGDLELHAYQETLEKLGTTLEDIVEVEDTDVLQKVGQEIISLVQRLLQCQSAGEKESGSRLDFKSS